MAAPLGLQGQPVACKGAGGLGTRLLEGRADYQRRQQQAVPAAVQRRIGNRVDGQLHCMRQTNMAAARGQRRTKRQGAPGVPRKEEALEG